MKTRIIINPVSGGRHRGVPAAARVEMAKEALQRWSAEGDVVLTKAADHARDLAREAVAARMDLVIAWGGDGTINEVASALVGAEPALGVVRAGSGNGAARELGILADPAQALDAAFRGPAHAIDTGEIDGRFFLNIAGIGLDATMARLFNQLGGDARGFRNYLPTTLRNGFGYRAKPYRLTVDGEQRDVDALVLAIANMPQYGNNAVVAAHARPDDGVLDLVVVGEHGVLGRLGLAARAFTRSLHRSSRVRTSQVRHVVVESPDPILFHVDGECFDGGCRVEAKVKAGSLRVSGVKLRG